MMGSSLCRFVCPSLFHTSPFLRQICDRSIDRLQAYLESRSSAVQEVEGHIAELGLIFNKLATMLQDQREMVERYMLLQSKHVAIMLVFC